MAPTRRTVVHRDRVGAATRRLVRVKRLATIVPQARMLAATGALPQALWGVEAQGLAPTHVKLLR